MTKTAYTYTILRYVHDTTTGEFINAGVVLVAADQRFLGVKVRHTYGRLSAMFPDLDRDAFRSPMRVIERALKDLAGTYAKDDLFPLEGDALAIARSVLPDDNSSLQWSPIGEGLTSDPAATLDHLFERLVARYDGNSERGASRPAPLGHSRRARSTSRSTRSSTGASTGPMRRTQ